MKNKNILSILIIIVLVIILAIMIKFAIFSDDNSNTGFTNNNKTSSTSTDSNTVDPIETSTDIELADITSEEYKDFDATVNLTDLSVDGSGVSISNDTITINKEGTYYFSGKLSDGNIVVNAEKSKVVLVFENAEITSSKTAVINVVKAKNVTINLVEGSTNVFTDSSNYTDFTDEDEPNSTIFSKSDLYIIGSGTLKINANYNNAIKSKDTLAIVDATLENTAKDHGIIGKDFGSIKNAKITINANGDGIKSTNDEDEKLGYIIIDGSKLNITSEEDGIQAETIVNITNSEITIKTTGEIAAKTNEMFKNKTTTTETDSTSSKGIKAGKEITINSGNITITSTDDSIHSNGYVIINDGKFEISSGDDAIHADNNILINNGTINITKSYEGIESNYIKINNGKISVIASDDGINVSGGNSEGMMGEGTSGTVADNARQLIINGGTIYVKAQGDGLDANGSIVINGGDITVVGTTSNGNGALDYDQKCNVNGGTIIVYGATGMWQNPSTSSAQYTICFGTSGNSGDKIILKDSNGNEIVNFEAENSYGAITISTPELKKGETYTLYVNQAEKSTQELTSIVTSNLTTGGMQGGMQGGRGR